MYNFICSRYKSRITKCAFQARDRTVTMEQVNDSNNGKNGRSCSKTILETIIRLKS